MSLCPRCKTAERVERSSYCKGCRSAKRQTYRKAHPAPKKVRTPLPDPGTKKEQAKRDDDGCTAGLILWPDERRCDVCWKVTSVEMHQGGEVLQKMEVRCVWLCHTCHTTIHTNAS